MDPILLSAATGYAGSALLRELRPRLPAIAGAGSRRAPGRSRQDAVHAMIAVRERPKHLAEVQPEGAGVPASRDMMRHVRLSGRRPRPLLDVPMSTSRLSSSWMELDDAVKAALP